MSKNNTPAWHFKGPLKLWHQRAFLLAEIRNFFHQRQVLEVQTPILSRYGNTDLQIDMFQSQAIHPNQQTSYLRTSPEFFHKRLLAAGVQDLFEIAKVFRQGEVSPLHNPEFTLLEWYRLGMSWDALADEVVQLVNHLLMVFEQEPLTTVTHSYQQLCLDCAGIDPFDISTEALNELCKEHGYVGNRLDRTAALDFVFALVIQPQLADPERYPPGVVIHDFPIAMAALAQSHPDLPDRCLRFEFLWRGVELANGYQELTDAKEQRQRFEQDNHLRLKHGKPELPIDEHLLGALAHGLPNCSGVAMGIDRLFMCLLGHDHLNDVMGFDASNS